MKRLILLLCLGLCSGLSTSLHAAGEPPGFEGLLDVHNQTRRTVGVPPLRWSPAGAAQAQVWAEQLARENCVARYNPDENRRQNWGENILRVEAANPYSGFRRSASEVAARWAEEVRDYDHVAHVCRRNTGTQCGQYLQMIWETTEEVGCGRARCERGEVWVCNYTPRGLQEELKPYGNPTLPPVSQAPPTQVVMGPLECSAVPVVGPGEEYPYSPMP